MQASRLKTVKPNIYQRADEGSLTLSVEALERMFAYRQLKWRDREAFGVLLGRYMVEGQCVVIDEVTEPQPADKRTRSTFTRSIAHQRLVEAAFEASGGTRMYAGEWHTHPEAYPTPSGRDLVAWARKLLDHRIVVDTLFFVIIGTRGMGVWEGNTRARCITKLTRIRESEK